MSQKTKNTIAVLLILAGAAIINLGRYRRRPAPRASTTKLGIESGEKDQDQSSLILLIDRERCFTKIFN
ncbi:hypothetical protein INP83_11985 [Mucilaginibacter sp. 21P]|uniref:hypothetical protein n=1 Tax=Mucilaginibacter sp. 21P TaxID=2778902 RepID=UPI001C568319|nr:hypothetical protein [Mucilaginibacter sp. 21P]QXV63826.1 hypothetical protein INP83_11985 [Mucilaginibacter sp. 21P]